MSLSRAVFAPGRFRLLLLSLLLFIIGTAVSPSFGGGRLLDFILLATTLAVALLELRVPGQRGMVPIVLAASVIFLRVVDLALPLRHVPVLASAIVGLFAGLVVWLAYGSVMRPLGDARRAALSLFLVRHPRDARLRRCDPGHGPGRHARLGRGGRRTALHRDHRRPAGGAVPGRTLRGGRPVEIRRLKFVGSW